MIESDAKAVFVVCEMWPQHSVSHCACRLRDVHPREVIRDIKALCQANGGRAAFRKLLRGEELLSWAEANNAVLSLVPEDFDAIVARGDVEEVERTSSWPYKEWGYLE